MEGGFVGCEGVKMTELWAKGRARVYEQAWALCKKQR